MAQTSPQDAIDRLNQAVMMAAPPPVDPHASLTAPIAAAPPEIPQMGMSAAGAAPEGGEQPTKMSLQPQEEHLSKRLMADYNKDADPYGSPDNHPGFLGKLLHGLSYATGGPGRREAEEQGLEGRLQNLSKEESTEGYQGAETAKDEAQTAGIPREQDDAHNLSESEVSEHNAQAANLLHPQAKTDFEAWSQQNPGHPIEEWLKLQNANKPAEHVAGMLNGRTMMADFRPADGKYYSPDGQELKGFQPVPPPVPAASIVLNPSQAGGYDAQAVRPGSHIAPGAVTVSGMNTVDTPTTQQRSASGRAATVVAMAPEVLSRIDALAPKLGPIEGRWNEYMQGKVGSDDPDFAALRSDLLMMSSAVALAHAQGRLPENLREEFDRAINAPKQTPENLKATINAMLPWLQQMQSQGQPNQRGTSPQGQQGSAPQRPANVPPSYHFDANGPKGAGWYK